MNTKILGVGQVIAALWASYVIFSGFRKEDEMFIQVFAFLVFVISLLFLIYLVALEIMIEVLGKNSLVFVRNVTFAVYSIVSVISSIFVISSFLNMSNVILKNYEWFISLNLGAGAILIISFFAWVLIRKMKYVSGDHQLGNLSK